MGITLYVPRHPLPGAAPSSMTEWLVPSPAPARDAPVHEISLPPAPPPDDAYDSAAYEREDSSAGVALRELVEENASPRRAPKIEVPVEAAPETQVTPPRASAPRPQLKAEPEISFHALLYPVGPELSVLCFVPVLARQQLQDRERVLLGNILRWLGVGEPDWRAARAFQWPLPNLPGGGVTLAGAGLRAFVDQAQREDGFARVLVFGGLLQEALEADGGLKEFYATYSLHELTAVPALKRECWLSLIPLQQRLQASRSQ